MNELDARIRGFLDPLKSEGRSSPAGLYWSKFYEFLCSRRLPGPNAPPVRLILGGSGEPNADKHQRLTEQLRWALLNDCLDEATEHLRSIPSERWNAGPMDESQRHSYPY